MVLSSYRLHSPPSQSVCHNAEKRRSGAARMPGGFSRAETTLFYSVLLLFFLKKKEKKRELFLFPYKVLVADRRPTVLGKYYLLLTS